MEYGIYPKGPETEPHLFTWFLISAGAWAIIDAIERQSKPAKP